MKKLIFVLLIVSSIILFYNQEDINEGYYFTYIVLPDTQIYSANYPEIFRSQLQWIEQNKETLNIQFVSHVGDIVEHNADQPNEWKVASDSMHLIEGVVPYGIIPGNHDIDKYKGEEITFNQYNSIFPVERFSHYEWYGGHYLENQNNYQLISVFSEDFIIINLQIDPTRDVIEWADKILKQHSNRVAVVTTHAYLYDDIPYRSDRSYFGNGGYSGEEIWQNLIKKNCNVRLVFSGHFHTVDGENYIKSMNDCGNSVHQIVQNYQHLQNGGNGWLRIYKFFPERQQIEVTTYSPYLNMYKKGISSNFSISY